MPDTSLLAIGYPSQYSHLSSIKKFKSNHHFGTALLGNDCGSRSLLCSNSSFIHGYHWERGITFAHSNTTFLYNHTNFRFPVCVCVRVRQLVDCLW